MINELDFSLYPHIPPSHRALAREFLSIANDENEPPKLRAFMTAMLRYLLDGCGDYEQMMSAAQEIGYRLPAYDGDMIGRPRDEYED